jgi:hypothetical protein
LMGKKMSIVKAGFGRKRAVRAEEERTGRR